MSFSVDLKVKQLYFYLTAKLICGHIILWCCRHHRPSVDRMVLVQYLKFEWTVPSEF